MQQLQLVSRLPSFSIVFFVLKQSLDIYLFFRFHLVLLCGLSGRQRPLFCRLSFFKIITRSSNLVKIKWSVCISKSHRCLCVLFFTTNFGLCIYNLFIWPNFIFFAQFPVDPVSHPVIFILYHYYLLLESFSYQCYLTVFHRSLSDSKSNQVSRTLLSILDVLNNAVVWMFSTRPLTSKSSSPFNSPLVTVPNTPITIGIIVTFMFHSFFLIPKQGRGTYLSVLFCGHNLHLLFCCVLSILALIWLVL